MQQMLTKIQLGSPIFLTLKINLLLLGYILHIRVPTLNFQGFTLICPLYTHYQVIQQNQAQVFFNMVTLKGLQKHDCRVCPIFFQYSYSKRSIET
jgi:hypothetical protein